MPLWGMAQNVDAMIRETVAYGSSKDYFFKHFDVGVTAGTSGFGIDFTTQLTSWAQVRVGYNISPVFNLKSSLDVWKPLGMKDDDSVQRLLSSVLGKSPEETINLESEFDMQNVKLLFDVFPIKRNRNFHVTVGAYYGPKHLGSFISNTKSFNTLSYLRAYNMIYNNAKHGKFFDLSPLGISLPKVIMDELNETVLPRIVKSEDMTIPVGTYAHDICDEAGNVIYHQGETVMLRPDGRDVVEVSVSTSHLKPFVGVGYSLPLTKDRRSLISLDAGVMLWKKPTATTNVVEQDGDHEHVVQIDLIKDVDHVPGDLGKYVRTFGKLNVYPEISLRFSQRIW